MLTFAVFFGLALVLTFFAMKNRLLLFRVACILGWLGIGILAWTSPATIGIDAYPDGVKYVVSLICIVMIFAIWQMQAVTDIRHEMQVRGKVGQAGSVMKSWTTTEPTPDRNKLTKWQLSEIRQREYKEQLHQASIRAARRRRYR